MKDILVNSKEIESVWETEDACFVKMKSGKVWVCEKTMITQTYNLAAWEIEAGCPLNDEHTVFEHIKNKNGLMSIPLKNRGVK